MKRKTCPWNLKVCFITCNISLFIRYEELPGLYIAETTSGQTFLSQDPCVKNLILFKRIVITLKPALEKTEGVHTNLQDKLSCRCRSKMSENITTSQYVCRLAACTCWNSEATRCRCMLRQCIQLLNSHSHRFQHKCLMLQKEADLCAYPARLSVFITVTNVSSVLWNPGMSPYKLWKHLNASHC